MRLSFLQYAALTLFAPLAMIACDVPVPSGGSPSVAEPTWTSSAVTLSGELSERDAKRAGGQKEDIVDEVVVQPGHTLQVLMESNAFDPLLTLYVKGSDQTFVNDDFNGSRSRSYVSQTNPSSEAIRVEIGASAYAQAGRGEYAIRYQILTPPEPRTGQPISMHTSVDGTLDESTPKSPLLSNDAERKADAYTLTVSSGETATVRMESAQFDPYLLVLRNGSFHARNDDHNGSRAVSQVRLTAPSTYTILAGAFSASGAGAYSLSVTGESPDPKTTRAEPTEAPAEGATSGPGLPLGRDGGRYAGELTDSDDEVPLTLNNDMRKVDAHHIRLEASETVVITLESEFFDTYLKMDLDGSTVSRNDDAGSTRRSQIRYTATRGGTYTVYAGTFSSSGRGQYALSWEIE